MNASLPLVSVVTPVRNGEIFLAERIESVLAQSYQNWEYLIVDDRSAAHGRINTRVSDILQNLLEYGPIDVTKQEYEGRLEDLLLNPKQIVENTLRRTKA